LCWLFRTISRQLIGRARLAGTPDEWTIADNADQRLETLEQRVACYHMFPAVLLAAILSLTIYLVFNMPQEPGLVVQQEPAADSSQMVALYNEIQNRQGSGPVLAIAASGGGTRAACAKDFSSPTILRGAGQMDLVYAAGRGL
jgi:hypothetical protein